MIFTAVKLAALFVLIWFGSVNVVKASRGQPVPAANLALMSAGAVAFAWSMGWLA